METVPVILRSVRIDENALGYRTYREYSGRENLNPIEEAQGLQRLIDEFAFTHEAAAKAVGRSRPAANAICFGF